MRICITIYKTTNVSENLILNHFKTHAIFETLWYAQLQIARHLVARLIHCWIRHKLENPFCFPHNFAKNTPSSQVIGQIVHSHTHREPRWILADTTNICHEHVHSLGFVYRSDVHNQSLEMSIDILRSDPPRTQVEHLGNEHAVELPLLVSSEYVEKSVLTASIRSHSRPSDVVRVVQIGTTNIIVFATTTIVVETECIW